MNWNRIINIFLDTSIVNRILDLEETCLDPRWEQDRAYLSRFVKGPISTGAMVFLVNPTVMSQIRDTPDFERRRRLSSIAERFRFTELNVTILSASSRWSGIGAQAHPHVGALVHKNPSVVVQGQ